MGAIGFPTSCGDWQSGRRTSDSCCETISESDAANPSGQRSAAADDRSDAMFWAQRDRSEGLDGMARHEVQTNVLQDRGEQLRGLDHRERRADADPRPSPKGEVGEPRNLSGANRVFAPSLGIECFWIGEKPRVALRQPLKDENVRAR